MSEAKIATTTTTQRNLLDLRSHLQALGPVVLNGDFQLTALDFPLFSFDNNTFPGSPCPTENLILPDSPHLHEEITGEKKQTYAELNGNEEFSNLSLDPVLEDSVDIQQLLNNTSQVNDETLEKLILDVKTSDIGSIANVSTPTTAIPSTVTNLSEIDFMSCNNTESADLTVGWDLLTVKAENTLGSCAGTKGALADSLVTSSTITPPPSPSESYTRGRPGRKPSAGGPIRTNKKRQPEKGTEEYFDKRSRNNVAVRKSREKAKQKQKDTEGRVQQLVNENENLQKRLDLLTKELNVLKGLFINVGANLPANFEKLLAK
ncbi:hypothetical protein FSP39_000228 [Pinctada imbricata]|uniref:BZIP domain-containing protein n=2 Tax=Pinctada TaxID=50425 RepID=A0AA89BJX5_PINIB|nr:C/EBP-A [Pinctada fucata]KAK3085228.1 hypothetical protein FSP39_000228 [Pinctada imbricata]